MEQVTKPTQTPFAKTNGEKKYLKAAKKAFKVHYPNPGKPKRIMIYA